MKTGMFFRRADGVEIPIKEVTNLSGLGTVILQTSIFLSEEDNKRLQEYYSRLFGERYNVVVIDAAIEKVLRLST